VDTSKSRRGDGQESVPTGVPQDTGYTINILSQATELLLTFWQCNCLYPAGPWGPLFLWIYLCNYDHYSIAYFQCVFTSCI
jgi:hypothetical protein